MSLEDFKHRPMEFHPEPRHDGFPHPSPVFSTLVEMLRHRAAEQPQRLSHSFLLDGETEETSLTYAQLEQRAMAIAVLLQEMGAAGQRVLLLYPPGLEYIAAFFGCLCAGVVAVPAYPPRMNRSLSRLQAIAHDAQPVAALTTAALLGKAEKLFAVAPELSRFRWLSTDDIELDNAQEWQEPRLAGDTLAFLQYTSGSTSTPKGVMVSHGNLLHNEQTIQRVFRQSEQSLIVGWLPLYHDMGLIGNVLQPVFLGASCILMSPAAFLQRPLRWLQAISRYRATTSGGPNFAYELCVNKVRPEELDALDLSSWSVAFNGAEPVRAETLARFADAFAPCGFRREAFYPCYGLAEATLLVSGKLKTGAASVERVVAKELERDRIVQADGEGAEARALVGCGGSLSDQSVLIVNPETSLKCAPGVVGEVWVSGPSVAQGYWNRPDETKRTFEGRLADTGEGPFLRTGDLGFLHD
ncbi:MAG TPA: fatty acyl-AMP ligase, partial [Pyrinomonadaceae bacterium]|nr:fatty acyl-AMP ligase [Pyrinomonadaceae bacterium]